MRRNVKLNNKITSSVEIQIKNSIIFSVKRIELLRDHIDGRLDFDYHVSQICKKASKKYTLYLGYTFFYKQPSC